MSRTTRFYLLAAWIAVTTCHASGAMAQASSPIAGPSFDCSNATTATEQQICLVPDLSRLDIEISTAYLARLGALVPKRAAPFKTFQRAWIRQRNACGAGTECLQTSMQDRLAQLLAKASPVVLARVMKSGGAPTKTVEPATLPASAFLSPASSGDEWRGAYTCGGSDYYMRLSMTNPLDTTASVAGTIEFGPTPSGASTRGSFSVAGKFSKPDGSFHLEPQDWVHQAWPSHPMFGLNGHRVSDDLLTGTVVGPAECTKFHVWHHHVARAQNPNGLVLKMSEPSDDDCRNYATWVSSGRELQFGSYYVSSLVFDTPGQLRVLGHTVDQWTSADASKYQDVVNTCQRTLSSSDDPDDTNLLQQAGLFSIAPFDQDPANCKLPGWDRVHAIVVLRADAEKQAADRLARLAALPSSPSTLQDYDQELSSAQDPTGDLRYLDKVEQQAYVNQLQAQRQALEPTPSQNGQSSTTGASVSSDNTTPSPLGALLMLGIAAALANHSNAASQPSGSSVDQGAQGLQDQIQRDDDQATQAAEQRLQDEESEEDREQQIRDEDQYNQDQMQIDLQRERDEQNP